MAPGSEKSELISRLMIESPVRVTVGDGSVDYGHVVTRKRSIITSGVCNSVGHSVIPYFISHLQH